jgi:hypothetical protein
VSSLSVPNNSMIVLHLFLAAGVLVILAGCREEPVPRAPVGSCSLTLAPDTVDAEAIRAVLNAEGELMVAQDIDPLMALWLPESQVVDAKNTADDPDDDQTWNGHDAIRHRYVRTVFPGAPAAAQPADLDIQIGQRGELLHAIVRGTTTIDDEIAPAGDRWELLKVDGCWLIERLTYNLEAQ